jgi:aryl-alcohol dehydrogenase-like predicted oxidoreductase
MGRGRVCPVPTVLFYGREVEGRSFDRGETFAGVDYDTGLQAAEELRPLVPPGATMAEMALRWILMFDDVTCAIAGGLGRSSSIGSSLQ